VRFVEQVRCLRVALCSNEVYLWGEEKLVAMPHPPPRSSSAPPVVTDALRLIDDSPDVVRDELGFYITRRGEQVDPVRFTAEYHDFYRTQRRLDPRLPTPLRKPSEEKEPMHAFLPQSFAAGDGMQSDSLLHSKAFLRTLTPPMADVNQLDPSATSRSKLSSRVPSDDGLQSSPQITPQGLPTPLQHQKQQQQQQQQIHLNVLPFMPYGNVHVSSVDPMSPVLSPMLPYMQQVPFMQSFSTQLSPMQGYQQLPTPIGASTYSTATYETGMVDAHGRKVVYAAPQQGPPSPAHGYVATQNSYSHPQQLRAQQPKPQQQQNLFYTPDPSEQHRRLQQLQQQQQQQMHELQQQHFKNLQQMQASTHLLSSKTSSPVDEKTSFLAGEDGKSTNTSPRAQQRDQHDRRSSAWKGQEEGGEASSRRGNGRNQKQRRSPSESPAYTNSTRLTNTRKDGNHGRYEGKTYNRANNGQWQGQGQGQTRAFIDIRGLPFMISFLQDATNCPYTAVDALNQLAEAERPMRLVDVLSDQVMSRFMQRKISCGKHTDLDAIYNDLFPHILRLSDDNFGNYVVQELIKKCSYKRRVELSLQLKTHIVRLSQQISGCRVVQRLLVEMSDPSTRDWILEELLVDIVPLMMNQNGNHVIQKLIQKSSTRTAGYIFNAVRKHIYPLAVHCYGCRVIQSLLDKVDAEAKREGFAQLLSHC
jgi:hypothetical protein